MEAHLKNYLKTQQQEELHRFRVQVKKLKALLILVDECNKSTLIADFKPVKRVFKQAGKLRDSYISGLNPGIQGADTVIQKFLNRGSKYRKSINRAYGELRGKLCSAAPKKIRRFYEDQLQRIAAQLVARPSAQRLHDCRKRIKVLLYNYPLVRGELRQDLDTSYLDLLQEAIGNWHDQWLTGTITTVGSPLPDKIACNFYQRALGQPDHHQAPN